MIDDWARAYRCGEGEVRIKQDTKATNPCFPLGQEGPDAGAFAVCGKPVHAQWFLDPLIRQWDAHCVGILGEILDGGAPHSTPGCIAHRTPFGRRYSAGVTVLELPRVWKETDVSKERMWPFQSGPHGCRIKLASWSGSGTGPYGEGK